MFSNNQTESIRLFNKIYYFILNKDKLLRQDIQLLLYEVGGINKDIFGRKRGQIFFDT